MKKNNSLSFEAGNLYEFNKQLINQDAATAAMNTLELAAAQQKLKEWFKNIRYAMLLCRDINYYTVFNLITSHNDDPASFAAEQTIGCLEDQEGDILSIELQDDNAWEIWIKINKDPIVFYLFDYEKGIIEC